MIDKEKERNSRRRKYSDKTRKKTSDSRRDFMKETMIDKEKERNSGRELKKIQ